MYATITSDQIIDSGISQSFGQLLTDLAEAPAPVRTPQARCADGNGTLTHLFFSDDALSTARAKAGSCARSCDQQGSAAASKHKAGKAVK